MSGGGGGPDKRTTAYENIFGRPTAKPKGPVHQPFPGGGAHHPAAAAATAAAAGAHQLAPGLPPQQPPHGAVPGPGGYYAAAHPAPYAGAHPPQPAGHPQGGNAYWAYQQQQQQAQAQAPPRPQQMAQGAGAGAYPMQQQQQQPGLQRWSSMAGPAHLNGAGYGAAAPGGSASPYGVEPGTPGGYPVGGVPPGRPQGGDRHASISSMHSAYGAVTPGGAYPSRPGAAGAGPAHRPSFASSVGGPPEWERKVSGASSSMHQHAAMAAASAGIYGNGATAPMAAASTLGLQSTPGMDQGGG